MAVYRHDEITVAGIQPGRKKEKCPGIYFPGELAVEGVQFHPESVLTVPGEQMLQNFLCSLEEPCLAGKEAAALLCTQ